MEINEKNLSIGVDIEEISRFRKKSRHYWQKIFTPKEIRYCQTKKNAAGHFAGRFAAKEAIIKALFGLGIQNLTYQDLEISNTLKGEPYLESSKKLKNKMRKNVIIKISISHSANSALAFSVAVKSD